MKNRFKIKAVVLAGMLFASVVVFASGEILQHGRRVGLHGAVEARNLSGAEKILKGGALVDERDSDGNTPLQNSLKHGDLEMAQLLVEHGADVNAPSTESSLMPLAMLAMNYRATGAPWLLKLMLKQGANVNAVDSIHGETALNVLAQLMPGYPYVTKHSECARILIRAGADLTKPAKDGLSPLHTAAYGMLPNMVEQLINADGTIVDILSPNGLTPLHFAVRRNPNVLAVMEGSGHELRNILPEVITKLINKGANINAKTVDGRLPLDLAIDAYFDAEGNERMVRLGAVQLLLERGAGRGSANSIVRYFDRANEQGNDELIFVLRPYLPKRDVDLVKELDELTRLISMLSHCLPQEEGVGLRSVLVELKNQSDEIEESRDEMDDFTWKPDDFMYSLGKIKGTIEELLKSMGEGANKRSLSSAKNRIEWLQQKVGHDWEQCPICLEPRFKYELMTFQPCNHAFHHKCISEMMRHSTLCPVCRDEIQSTIPGEVSEKESKPELVFPLLPLPPPNSP